MQTKDILIQKTAIELGQPEELVNKVVSYSYKQLSEASKIHDQLEVSGFGVLLVSAAKLKKRIAKNERILNYLLALEQTEETLIKIENVKKYLEYYNTRLNKYDE